jgi:hypothetical protein
MDANDDHVIETAGRDPYGALGLDDNPEVAVAAKPMVFLQCSCSCDTNSAAGRVGWEGTSPYPPERQEEPRP